jgi:hypothetical protein
VSVYVCETIGERESSMLRLIHSTYVFHIETKVIDFIE